MSKRTIKILDNDNHVKKTIYAIQNIKRNLSNHTFNLIDQVGALSANLTNKDIHSLLGKCGFSKEEIDVYLNFPMHLSGQRAELENKKVTYHTIRSLLGVAREAVPASMFSVAQAGAIGENDVKHINNFQDEITTSDEDANFKERNSYFSEKRIKFGESEVNNIEELSNIICECVQKIRNDTNYISYIYNIAYESEIYSHVDEQEFNFITENFHELEKQREAAIEESRQLAVKISRIAISQFDHVFPEANIPKLNWLDPDVSNVQRQLSQSRYSLNLLIKTGGTFALYSDSTPVLNWSLESSIRYLAGLKSDSKSLNRFNPIFASQLNAIIINSTTGAEAVGLEDAGFRVRGILAVTEGANKTVASNRRDWPLGPPSVERDNLSTEVQKFLKPSERLDLLLGSIPNNWFENTPVNPITSNTPIRETIDFILNAAPEAFVFETDIKIFQHLEREYVQFFRREIENNGFKINIQKINSLDFGICQSRERTVIYGIKDSYCKNEHFILFKGFEKSKYMYECIHDLAFPYYSEIENNPNWSSKARKAYTKWVQHRKDKLDRKRAPDTNWLLEKGGKTSWLGDTGLSPDINEEIVAPHENWEQTSSVPLTVGILKRLQGIPDDWKIASDVDEQLQHICFTTPPKIVRFFALKAQSSISGRKFNFDIAADAEIKSRRQITVFNLKKTRNYSDEQRRSLWKQYITDPDSMLDW